MASPPATLSVGNGAGFWGDNQDAPVTLARSGRLDVLTLEYKVNFLRPAAGQRLIAEGFVLRAGRSVAVTRVDVFVEGPRGRLRCAALKAHGRVRRHRVRGEPRSILHS